MRKINKHLFLAISLLILVSSCERNELPESTLTNEPVFFLDGNLFSDELFIQAGEEDITVNPTFEVQSNNVPKFTAGFSNEMNQGLFIELSGQNTYSNDLDILDYINTGEMDIQICHADPPINSFSFDISPDQTIGVTISGIELPIINWPVDFQINPGPFAITMTNFAIGCESNIYHSLFNSGDLGDFELPEIIIENDQFSYNMGSYSNGMVELVVNEIPIFGIEPNTIVPIEDVLEVNDENISSVQLFYYMDGNLQLSVWSFINPGSYCIPELNIQPSDSSIDLALSKACIKYVDENNTEYVSVESMDANFEILDMEIYAEDPLGRDAYKLKIQCDVELVNVNEPTDAIQLNIEEAYIPVVLE